MREIVLWVVLCSCGGDVARGPCAVDAGRVADRECLDVLLDAGGVP